MKRETFLRPATPADVPAMLALERDTPNAAHWTESQYQALFSGSRTALVIDSGSVHGFAVARDLGPEWEIENVVVAPAVQRRGLGTRLLAAILDLARTRGAEAVFLEVRESNGAARALYEKCGFIASGRRLSYYDAPNEDAIVYKFSFHSKSAATAPETC